MDWYVIQAFSNCEKKVKAAIEERIEISGLSKMFGEIMIPTEQVTELKKGQKKQLERKFFPGYMHVSRKKFSLKLLLLTFFQFSYLLGRNHNFSKHFA